MNDNDLHSTGLKARRDVLGQEYVGASLAGSDEFMMVFQDAVTELAWGYAWSRPGLDRRSRVILTLGILAGLGRHQELGIYAQGAIRNGVTVDEIKEILIHVTSYCGTPSGRQAFLAVHDALDKIEALPKQPMSG
ncbi:MAG: carboxymuconolactone decarboxylase family protein [Dermatophilaceae bacterium]